MTDDISSTAARTLRLAEALLLHPEGLSPQELLEQAGGSRSTLFVLLQELKSLGYAEQAERRGRYRPGPRLLAWAGGSGAAADLTLAFYQEAARQPLAETLALLVPSEGGPLVLAQQEGSALVRCAFTTGQALPLAAGGQALLSAPPEMVRQNGYALTDGPQSLDLALPICRDGIRPEAALLLSVPAFRWQPRPLLETFLPDLRVMAARLSYRLGAPFYAPYRADPLPDLQPAGPLTPEAIGAFLQGPWAARLACVRPDGRPHVIPVWQEWDGQAFHVIAWQGSQWAEYVLQNPNVSLTIDEPWPPLRRVVSRGQASPLDAATDLRPLLERLARRYLGQPLPPGRVLRAFRIQPETLRGWQGI
jgi:DNA-binding IclR family transcriptional regulator/nitroimidazol reductase NimA-like FMN-containing flavoprotein (pyridoxamine 5'-phosphate oxidase superfamily)